MKYQKAYEILDNYQFQDWNCLTDEYKKQLDDMKKTCLKALKERIKLFKSDYFIPYDFIDKFIIQTTGKKRGDTIDELPEHLRFAIQYIEWMLYEYKKQNNK